MNHRSILTLVFSITLSSHLLSSSLNKKMGEWFDNVNTTANISSPEMINSQLGVHFLGGGATSRANVYDINPIHVSTPKISAGCGGIDFTLGA
ncbi:MAG: conjugal transfer protein TraH, partial [Simkaniaceae bacterium]|nr:conjugal transfer protein TraH [Simkaniaceae bacterium]